MAISKTGLTKGASHIPYTLTLWETLQKCFLIPVIVSFTLIGLVKDLCSLKLISTKSLKRAIVKNAAHSSKSLTLRQIRASRGPTNITITKVCQTRTLSHRVVELDVPDSHPANLHLITLPEDNKAHDNRITGDVLLYFHGGGYIFPASDAHVAFTQLAARAVGSSSTTIAILEYTLAPECRYPGQLAQAAAALTHLLITYHPDQIIIGGDSAGGNLTLSLLAHLTHPHPDIPPVSLHNNTRLKAAFCLSPRCANTATADSFHTNATHDIISPGSVAQFNAAWHPAVDDIWATPLRGDRAFWARAPIGRALLLVGDHESYRDDVVAFARVFGASLMDPRDVGERSDMEKRSLVVCPGEFHDMCIVDLGVGIRDGVMLTSVLAWLGSL